MRLSVLFSPDFLSFCHALQYDIPLFSHLIVLVRLANFVAYFLGMAVYVPTVWLLRIQAYHVPFGIAAFTYYLIFVHLHVLLIRKYIYGLRLVPPLSGKLDRWCFFIIQLCDLQVYGMWNSLRRGVYCFTDSGSRFLKSLRLEPSLLQLSLLCDPRSRRVTSLFLIVWLFSFVYCVTGITYLFECVTFSHIIPRHQALSNFYSHVSRLSLHTPRNVLLRYVLFFFHVFLAF